MNKWLIALALVLVTTAGGMAGYRWQHRRVATQVKGQSCLRSLALAMEQYAKTPPATAPAAPVVDSAVEGRWEPWEGLPPLEAQADRPLNDTLADTIFDNRHAEWPPMSAWVMESNNIYSAAPTTQPATRPSARGPIILGCSKNHDTDGQNVLYADGSPEFLATTLKSDSFFSATTLPAPDLWDILQQGGYVIVFRHAKTVGSGKDPDNFKLADRATQRNLSDEGIAQAKAIGQRFRDRKVPVSKVLSSEYFRCRETAELAFGQVTAEPVLNSLEDEQQAERLRKLLETKPAQGNTVLVTHQANLKAMAGMIPEMGDAVVVQPTGDGSFRVLGVLKMTE